jgi:hypothetical protein
MSPAVAFATLNEIDIPRPQDRRPAAKPGPSGRESPDLGHPPVAERRSSPIVAPFDLPTARSELTHSTPSSLLAGGLAGKGVIDEEEDLTDSRPSSVFAGVDSYANASGSASAAGDGPEEEEEDLVESKSLVHEQDSHSEGRMSSKETVKGEEEDLVGSKSLVHEQDSHSGCRASSKETGEEEDSTDTRTDSHEDAAIGQATAHGDMGLTDSEPLAPFSGGHGSPGGSPAIASAGEQDIDQGKAHESSGLGSHDSGRRATYGNEEDVTDSRAWSRLGGRQDSPAGSKEILAQPESGEEEEEEEDANDSGTSDADAGRAAGHNREEDAVRINGPRPASGPFPRSIGKAEDAESEDILQFTREAPARDPSGGEGKKPTPEQIASRLGVGMPPRHDSDGDDPLAAIDSDDLGEALKFVDSL